MVDRGFRIKSQLFMGMISLLIALGLYSLFDVTPPSFVLAVWGWPSKASPGETFIIKEIFVRNHLCARFIQNSFRQDNDVYPLPPQPAVLWPAKFGLIQETWETEIPLTISPGQADFTMTIIWQCWWNPIQWFRPIVDTTHYPIWINDVGQGNKSSFFRLPRKNLTEPSTLSDWSGVGQR